VALEYEQTEAHIRELLAALEEVDGTIVFTYPNADTRSQLIIKMIRDFTRKRSQAQIAVNLGTLGYFSMMKLATAMVGNSSSGIIEAASFKLPVVNIGSRQQGRVRGKNVIDVGCTRGEILAGIKKAVSQEFCNSLVGLVNTYGDGHAAERIVDRLKHVELNDKLLRKHFYKA